MKLRVTALLFAAALVTTLVACGGGSAPRPPAKDTTTLRTGGVDVNMILRPPAQSVTGTDQLVTVLFLHGQSYDSHIWDDRKILDAVVSAGWRAAAVDLPGHGETPERPETVNGKRIIDAAWLRGLIDKLGGPGSVVVVSPSMSGTYSLPYLEAYPHDHLLGFVPVAPLGIDDLVRSTDAAPISTMSIWGSDDPSYSEPRAEQLITQMRAPDGAAQTQVIDGAGHACYDDEPTEFTAILLGFLRSLVQTGS